MEVQGQSVLWVDLEDRPIGLIEKLEAHRKGVLHRAFSVFIFRHTSSNLELLLQQRARGKYHSGGLWTNTCCGHADPLQPVHETAKIRLHQEMGFSSELQYAGSFHYKIPVGQEMIEHEIDHVFIGFHNPLVIQLDPEEAENYQWASLESLKKVQNEQRSSFTAWFFLALELAIKKAEK